MDENKGMQMVLHHVKYLELHGEDETIWMTNGEHQALHRRLRKEGKCKVPQKELHDIASKARGRTNKRIAWKKEYECNKQYHNFCESIGYHLSFVERIWYNYKNGNVGYTSRFIGDGGAKLPIVDVM